MCTPLLKNPLLLKNAVPESSINCSSNIKDHWSHTIMTNKMKNLDIAWELLKCDTETWSEQRFLEKWHQATKLKLVRKAISSKHSKPKVQ